MPVVFYHSAIHSLGFFILLNDKNVISKNGVIISEHVAVNFVA